MPTYILPFLALDLALLDWLAVAKSWKSLEYIAKPAVMLILLAWLWQADISAPYNWLFGAGLFFSMLGDIFLTLPAGWFLPGLVAFLLAQLAYVAGFTTSLPPRSALAVIFAILIAIPALLVYRQVARGLEGRGRPELKLPVLAYTIVISLMLFSASLTLLRPQDEWQKIPAVLATVGAALFYFSDSLLGWRLFVNPFRFDRMLGITSYHVGQFAITYAVILNYGLD